MRDFNLLSLVTCPLLKVGVESLLTRTSQTERAERCFTDEWGTDVELPRTAGVNQQNILVLRMLPSLEICARNNRCLSFKIRISNNGNDQLSNC